MPHRNWVELQPIDCLLSLCPSSSSMQCRSVQAVALVYKKFPSLHTGHIKIEQWLGHVYISRQFLGLVTLSVTAWTQLVHTCEQVIFQVGQSNLNCCGCIHNLRTSVKESLQMHFKVIPSQMLVVANPKKLLPSIILLTIHLASKS